jgi:hypothetical protein
MVKTRKRGRKMRGGGEGMFSSIGDTLKNTASKMYGFLGFGSGESEPPMNQMISESSPPPPPLPPPPPPQALPQALPQQQPYGVGGRRKRCKGRVRMAHKQSLQGKKFRLFRGGSNVTPYSSDLWDAHGVYPKSIGGMRRHRRKYASRRAR